MALYALDQNKWIYAADADPLATYHCPECHLLVRLKKGAHRIPHFYHLRKQTSCKLYFKKEDHHIFQLQLQKKILSHEQVELEKAFPEIQRIADLVIEEKKIIIEIQCSLIDLSEVKKRIKDYAKLGYQIIWLLDDRIFNQKNLRLSERFLRESNGYFFSFHKEKRSLIYDQCEFFMGQKRVRKSLKSEIDFENFYTIPSIDWPKELFPSLLQMRLEKAFCYLKGDLIHKALLSFTSKGLSDFFQKWREEEKKNESQKINKNILLNLIDKFFLTPYKRFVLSKISRY